MGIVGRSILAMAVAAAIVGLIAFARGTPEHREPDQAPTAAYSASAG